MKIWISAFLILFIRYSINVQGGTILIYSSKKKNTCPYGKILEEHLCILLFKLLFHRKRHLITGEGIVS